MFIWGGGNAIAKIQCTHLPIIEVLVVRGCWILLFILPYMLWQFFKGNSLFASNNIKLEMWRGLAGFIDLVCVFGALYILPLAESVTLYFTVVFFIAILAKFYLGERFNRQKVFALILGFLGVLLIVQPQMSTKFLGWALAIAGALGEAHVMVLSRMLSRYDTPLQMIFFHTVVILVLSLICLPFFLVPLTWNQIFLLGVMSFLGLVGQYCFIKAYSMMPAMHVAPFLYTQIIWAILFDALIWGVVPNGIFYAGAALIIFGGILVGRHTTQDENGTMKKIKSHTEKGR